MLKWLVKNWENLTKDKWVILTIKGYVIEFKEEPKQLKKPSQLVFQRELQEVVGKEVLEMLQKGAIEKVLEKDWGFVSTIFLVKKKDKGWRAVIHLRGLNQYVVYRHFKMEGINLLRDILQENDWLVKLDLKDAYFIIRIAEECRGFLQFRWLGELYQFTCLPFGLASAPWCFTKVLRPAAVRPYGRGGVAPPRSQLPFRDRPASGNGETRGRTDSACQSA